MTEQKTLTEAQEKELAQVARALTPEEQVVVIREFPTLLLIEEVRLRVDLMETTIHAVADQIRNQTEVTDITT